MWAGLAQSQEPGNGDATKHPPLRKTGMVVSPAMDGVPDDRLALESLLRWYQAMGVDASIDEEPHDRFGSLDAQPAARPAPVTGTAPIPPTSPMPSPPRRVSATGSTNAEALIRQAEALAAEATTLEQLFARLETLPGCTLAQTATKMIAAAGTPGARVMLIGAAPEADDERHGDAFAGKHGALLDAMMRAIDLGRAEVHLANLIPWRPPGARAPTPLELALCLPFARRHIALADPALLVCLGERAAQPLLGSRDPISRLRGRWLSFEGDAKTVKTLVTFAPDYLLKQPLQKRRAWADLQMLAAAL